MNIKSLLFILGSILISFFINTFIYLDVRKYVTNPKLVPEVKRGFTPLIKLLYSYFLHTVSVLVVMYAVGDFSVGSTIGIIITTAIPFTFFMTTFMIKYLNTIALFSTVLMDILIITAIKFTTGLVGMGGV